MKKLVASILVFMLLCACALAAPIDDDPSLLIYGELDYEYIRYGDYGKPLSDLLPLIGADTIFTDESGEPSFGIDAMERLLEYQSEIGLEQTGYFDFETLRALLPPPTLSDYSYMDMDQIVWIPMHGGKKHHCDADCSNMVEPRQMPRDCALSLGFTPCKRCYPHS